MALHDLSHLNDQRTSVPITLNKPINAKDQEPIHIPEGLAKINHLNKF